MTKIGVASIINFKCPYNEFKDCFEFQCPFFYKRYEIVDHGTGSRDMVPHCKRAEKELEGG